MSYNNTGIWISGTGTITSSNVNITSGTLSYSGNSTFSVGSQWGSNVKTEYIILDNMISSTSVPTYYLDLILANINTMGIEWYINLKKNSKSEVMSYIPLEIKQFLEEESIRHKRNEKIKNIIK